MNVYALQLDIVWEDKPANFARIRALLHDDPPRPGSMIVLPEMFSTGFSLNLAVTQQDDRREDESFLAQLAREHRSTVIGGVVSSGSSRGGCNQAVAFSARGEMLARYTRRFIRSVSVAKPSIMRPGGSRDVSLQRFNVGAFVCYASSIPEYFSCRLTPRCEPFRRHRALAHKRQHHC